MALYISLYKLTEQGMKNIKDAPGRYEKGVQPAEAMGGKVLGFYATMGEYDYVSIGEFPNDEVATTFLLALGSLGNVKTTTMKAFSSDQFKEIVGKLP